MAEGVPEGYRSLLRQFVRMQGSVRVSAPEVSAKVIWTAATDGRARYHAGPDATSIPSAKRLMGAAGYWRLFRRTLLDGPGWLTRLMTPQRIAAMEFGENIRQLEADAQ